MPFFISISRLSLLHVCTIHVLTSNHFIILSILLYSIPNSISLVFFSSYSKQKNTLQLQSPVFRVHCDLFPARLLDGLFFPRALCRLSASFATLQYKSECVSVSFSCSFCLFILNVPCLFVICSMQSHPILSIKP